MDLDLEVHLQSPRATTKSPSGKAKSKSPGAKRKSVSPQATGAAAAGGDLQGLGEFPPDSDDEVVDDLDIFPTDSDASSDGAAGPARKTLQAPGSGAGSALSPNPKKRASSKKRASAAPKGKVRLTKVKPKTKIKAGAGKKKGEAEAVD